MADTPAPDAIHATIDELADYARHARRDAYVPFEGDDKSAWIARARLVEAGWPATADLIPYPARSGTSLGPGTVVTPEDLLAMETAKHDGPECGEASRADVFAGVWCKCEVGQPGVDDRVPDVQMFDSIVGDPGGVYSDDPPTFLDWDDTSVGDVAQHAHVHDLTGKCRKRRSGPPCN